MNQILPNCDHLPTPSIKQLFTFFTYYLPFAHMDFFLTTYIPLLVHVVIQCPLSCVVKWKLSPLHIQSGKKFQPVFSAKERYFSLFHLLFTEISVLRPHYRNFCGPHCRKFLWKADETSFCVFSELFDSILLPWIYHIDSWKKPNYLFAQNNKIILQNKWHVCRIAIKKAGYLYYFASLNDLYAYQPVSVAIQDTCAWK